MGRGAAAGDAVDASQTKVLEDAVLVRCFLPLVQPLLRRCLGKSRAAVEENSTYLYTAAGFIRDARNMSRGKGIRGDINGRLEQFGSSGGATGRHGQVLANSARASGARWPARNRHAATKHHPIRTR